MEQLLQKAGSQAVTFAIRSGISIASGYAFKTLSQFIDTVPREDTSELDRIQNRLETSVKVLIPAIDLIELISSRGHTSLEYTLQLTRDLRKDIDQFQARVESEYETIRESKNTDLRRTAVDRVGGFLKNLLQRVEEAIPLITLALTTSGANLTASLPDYVSPGRFLQAANLLTSADSSFDGKNKALVGPVFSLVYYDIFYSSNRVQTGLTNNDITWKEEFAKCRAQLIRTCSKEEFSYELRLEEDFDDGRYHESDETPRVVSIDVRTITRLFFTASGRLLEIPDSQSPVLVLKLNKLFQEVKSTKVTAESEYNPQENVEWIALETHFESTSDSSDDSSDSESDSGDELAAKLSGLNISGRRTEALSVLEYLLRLAALQANDQKSMYEVHDERLSLYLRDDSHGRNNYDSDRSDYFEETPRSVRRNRRESPFTTPSSTKHSSRETPPITPWERDRFANQPILQPDIQSELSRSPFRDSPVKNKSRNRKTKNL